MFTYSGRIDLALNQLRWNSAWAFTLLLLLVIVFDPPVYTPIGVYTRKNVQEYTFAGIHPSVWAFLCCSGSAGQHLQQVKTVSLGLLWTFRYTYSYEIKYPISLLIY